MSLHFGNLSSRVRKDELERVFRRFGHCSVNLKDAYGFVVYDVPAHAEKALRVLHGKNICGEPILLSWSKQQPGSSHIFSRGNRLYESCPGMKSGTSYGYFNKRFSFNGHLDHKYDFKQQRSNGRETTSENIVDALTKYDEDNIKETARENQDYLKEDYPDEDDKIQKDHIDNDRWDTRGDFPSREVDGEPEFNCYDPHYDVDDIKDVDEYLPERYSGSSPTRIRSQDKLGRKVGEGALDNLDNSNPHRIYGEPGHKTHSCSQEDGSRRKKLSRFDDKPDNDFKGDRKRLGSRSEERLKFTRDVQVRRPKIERRFSRSIKHPRLMRSVVSGVQKEAYRGAWREDHVGRKRSWRENRSPDKRDAKKLTCSDHNVCRSHSKSKSSRSASRSDSHSRSLSRKAYSGNKKSRSRSSSLKSSSPSASLGQPLTSSPNKTQMNRDNWEDLPCLYPTNLVDEQGEQVQIDVALHSSKFKDIQVENVGVAESLKEEDNAQENHILQDGINYNSMENSSELRDDQYPHPFEKGETYLPDERTDSPALMLESTLSVLIARPVQEASSRSFSTDPVSISSEELGIVLKHYGLDVPTDDEKGLPVEAYFGSARLWPWQIIYYRRLKKGSISTENYARRIVQNQDFGIVDKYIRSSSGWEELDFSQ